MKVYSEINLKDFKAWSGATWTLDQLVERGKCEELEAILQEIYPDGLSSTQLNDLLWFESEWIFESIGLIGSLEV